MAAPSGAAVRVELGGEGDRARPRPPVPAAGNIHGRRPAVLIVLAAHLVSVAAMVVMLIFADTDRTVDLWLGDASIADVLWGAIVLDGPALCS